MVHQSYMAEVNNEFVISGNAAVLKCVLPSFVADFLIITGWTEEIYGESYYQTKDYGWLTCFPFVQW